MKNLLVATVVVLSLAACQTVVPESKIEISKVTTVNVGAGNLTGACYAQPSTPPAPIIQFHAGSTYEDNTILSAKIVPITEYLIKISGRYLATGSVEDQNAIINTLLDWSGKEAMTDWGNWKATVDSSWSTYYHAMAAIFPSVMSYGLVRDSMNPDQVAQVDAWLGGIIGRVNTNAVGTGGRKKGIWDYAGRQDNKSYQRHAINMAWGVIQGDKSKFNKGITAFHGAISDLRDDGSIKKETGRGGMAIHYSNTAIMNLISIAELAGVQGIDLYSFSDEEQSIHTAIKFLLDAIDNPKLIVGYAGMKTGGSYDKYSIKNQSMHFLEHNYSGETGFAWAKIYSARFPQSDIARRLRVAAPWLENDKPMFHYLIGMNTSCIVGLEGRS